MKLSDFYYELPKELIAQDPLEDRSSSRLMLLERDTGKTEHRIFKDIPEFLNSGDVLVLNETKVIPARLYGIKPESGAPVEILLLKRLSDTDWECIVKPGKKARSGAKLIFGTANRLEGEITKVKEDGNRIISFKYEGIFEEILDELGQMPLPPYITHKLEDKTRYQTVYAKNEGSAAAPTAGLHFTPQLLSQIEEKGVKIARITLHVGLGTFRPVKEENIPDHHMHSEYFEISEEAAQTINAARAQGGRIICVGTTSVRTLESSSTDEGVVLAGSGNTEIFIYPGYKFKACDCLITNFHLPQSTLLMLVSAFSGREKVMAAYEEAIREKYRFFSFGDAMFLYRK